MNIINQDILEVQEGIIVHQVNCMGVMGSGLAKQIKEKWPLVYDRYLHKHNYEGWSLGDIQITCVDKFNLYVCNLAGQHSFGRGKVNTKYWAIEKGLKDLSDSMSGILMFSKMYIPYKLGCGLGGGDWDKVSKIIEKVYPRAIICKL